jgi:hypothetical protein
MSSKINLQTCEYARKSSIFQDNQLIFLKSYNFSEIKKNHQKPSLPYSEKYAILYVYIFMNLQLFRKTR